ncbi:DUF4209 domain-containing protein [Solwaraspora sp. WMMD791]|uniref:DUF4209 domain-containing protein n=1 Tax=Solwaraspora sp. WMMD791 TaxID=3016086 RepID=UPI002499D925|nr:DUF4209 domain-containing protein [Solwaraspora sp. WMMD791]WFE26614.1 DUF4209 domain-containing protein [Solwaraspora sp. WMMD791]
MTSTAINDEGGGESIDASWWRPAILDDDDVPCGFLEPMLISIKLDKLRSEAEAAVSEGSLKVRVLDVLCKATSAMLVADNWGEPFAPAMQFGNERTVIPSDLSGSDLELLGRIVPLIGEPTLKARVADVVWTYGDRSNMEMLTAAVDSYRSLPLTPSCWNATGRDSWRRAIELSLRRGKQGRIATSEMAATLLGFLLGSDSSAAYMAIGVSDLLGTTGAIEKTAARDLADHLASVAATLSGDHRLRRAYEREAATWYGRLRENELANACVERIARAYIDEANERLARDNSALVAGTFLEKAIAVVRKIPRAYRSAHGLDNLLQDLRDRLTEVRTMALEQMHRIESESVNIARYIQLARVSVSGKSRIDALKAFVNLTPLIDATAATTDARNHLQSSILRLFSSSTFSTDGRKVAARGGIGAEGLSDTAVFAEVVRSFSWRVDLLVQALISPAFEVLTFEHRFDLDFLAEICHESLVVPQGHVYLWARGLWHGLSGDFPSAISVLVPQVEQMARAFLRARGAYTLIVDERGVESEKSLNALLAMPEAVRAFGPSLTLELRALLCEQLGPNLRNDLAHGLLNDPQSWSAAAIYAWWICLYLVLLPYFSSEADIQKNLGPREHTQEGKERV